MVRSAWTNWESWFGKSISNGTASQTGRLQQLIEGIDVSGDRKLQLDEFVGVDKVV
jgi:hypothetical protein